MGAIKLPSGVLEHKSGNISETRKDKGKDSKDTIEYTNSQTLFQTPNSATVVEIGDCSRQCGGLNASLLILC